jgi:hypothetical protein
LSDRLEITPLPIRIDIWRVSRVMLLTLVIPVTAAMVIGLVTGLLPMATIFAVVVFFPLATFVVNRTVLSEFNRVVEIVAPEPPPGANLDSDGAIDPVGSHSEADCSVLPSGATY